MSAETEIVMGWTGDSFIPASKHFAAVCDAHFVIGERYIVTAQAQRSMKSHRHYFATIGECFKNWPETAERQFDSADHLRAWALIRTGHRTERQFAAASGAEALRLAAFLRQSADYAEISVKGPVVVEWRAVSQSAHAMGAQAFAKSKDDVLAFLADIIGTPVATLRAQHEEPRRIEPPNAAGPNDLTVDEALEILWKGSDNDVHNLSVGATMIGTCWSMESAIEAIRKSKRRVFYDWRNHELGVVEADGRRSLFETDSEAVMALKARKFQSAGVASRGAGASSVAPAETPGADAPPRPLGTLA